MKPPAFGYSRPKSTAAALADLASLGPEAKVLAGGQSLVPLLSMRLAAPSHLVDINRLTELAYVRVTDGHVRVGALARHAEVLRDRASGTAQPLLAQALRLVAHPAIRNRGTTVGSLVHADPAAEMPAVLALLDGSVRVAREGSERVVAASEFFLGSLESAVQPGELATEAVFPVLGPNSGTAFTEVSRRRGDYALCGVAALVVLGDDGRIRHTRAAYLSVAPRPLVLDLTEAVDGAPADGAVADDSAALAAAGALARARVNPPADIHATAGYRRHLAGVLTVRALRQAVREAWRSYPDSSPERPPQAPDRTPQPSGGAPAPNSANPGGRPPGTPREASPGGRPPGTPREPPEASEAAGRAPAREADR